MDVYPEPPEALVDRCVNRFYLHMMGRNVLRYRVRYADVAKVAAVTTDDEVVALLRGQWRPRVMGAWLSAGRSSVQVRTALLESLTTSLGSLTAPPLATVAVLVADDSAVSALRAYLVNDLACDWGSSGFVAAAVEHLGGPRGLADVTEDDRQALVRMLKVGQRLGSALGD